MGLVHVRLNFEHKGGELVGERIDDLVACLARQGRHGHVKEALQKRLNAEVVERRTEEHGAELSVANLIDVKFIACTVEQLNIVAQGPAQLFTDKAVELFGVVKAAFDGLDLVLPTVEFAEGEDLAFFAVVNTLEVDAAADGPVHRICADAELLLQLLHKIVGAACLAVKLIYKGEDGDIAHCAYLKKLSRLRLDALCRVDDHDCAVGSHQGAVSVLGKILVSRSVEDVYAVAVILKLHDRGAY